MAGLKLNINYSDISQCLSERDKLNFDDICSAVFAGRANILIVSREIRTLTFLHDRLWALLRDDLEEGVALYGSKIVENFVADSLLGSYDYAFSKVTKDELKPKGKDYRRRVLVVKNCQILDEREIKIIIEANKANALQSGCIIAFFNTAENLSDCEKKINLFGDNVFNWEPDDLNFERADLKVSSAFNEDIELPKREIRKTEVGRSNSKSVGYLKRFVAISFAFFCLFFMISLLAFLGGYNFKELYDRSNRIPYIKKLISQNHSIVQNHLPKDKSTSHIIGKRFVSNKYWKSKLNTQYVDKLWF